MPRAIQITQSPQKLRSWNRRHSQSLSQTLTQIFALGLCLANLNLLTACSKDKDDRKDPDPKQLQWSKETQGKEQNFFQALYHFIKGPEAEYIAVMDENGAPIASAQVMIGNKENSPFAQNIFTTDSNGHIPLPANWNAPTAVTAWASGRVPVTYLQQAPHALQFFLKSSLNSQILEVKGQGTGFDIKDKDGWADFALMFEAIAKPNLLNFDLSMVISSQMDTMDVMGQTVSLPSNVALPKQKESYILPITLEKPIYRAYFNTHGPKMMYAMKGRFPFKTVVKEMKDDKPFHELINHFQIQSGSIRTVQVTNPSQNLDLPINELKFTEVKNYKAPAYDNQQYMVSIAGSMYEGRFLPTDVKTIDPNQNGSLVTAAGSTPLLLSVLQRKDHPDVVDRISSALTPLENNPEPVLINLLEKPKVTPQGLQVSLPTLPSQLDATGTYAVLSEVRMKTAGEFKAEVADKKWEVYANEWVSQVELPEIPQRQLGTGKRQWDIVVMAQNSQSSKDKSGSKKTVDLGPALFDASTHATRSSETFQ